MLEIVDRSLNWLARNGGNSIPTPVHPLMAAGQPSPFGDEYETWRPIASTVTDQQLDELEAAIGHRLPADYRSFLQHKHFYELHIGGADFFSHPVDDWQQILREELFDYWPEALQAGFVPFADYGGAGDVLCFDTRSAPSSATANYQVVFYDHEGGNPQFFSDSFATLLPQLLAETPKRHV